MTHVSRPPCAFSDGWPLGLVTAPKSTANVPSRGPFWRGGGSFPLTTMRDVTRAATIRMTAIGITIALRCHHGHGGGAASGNWSLVPRSGGGSTPGRSSACRAWVGAQGSAVASAGRACVGAQGSAACSPGRACVGAEGAPRRLCAANQAVTAASEQSGNRRPGRAGQLDGGAVTLVRSWPYPRRSPHPVCGDSPAGNEGGGGGAVGDRQSVLHTVSGKRRLKVRRSCSTRPAPKCPSGHRCGP